MEVISTDEETGGKEEFVVLDYIAVNAERFVLIFEAKRSATMTNSASHEDGDSGIIYGFVTTGADWRMVRYDGIQMKNGRSITRV